MLQAAHYSLPDPLFTPSLHPCLPMHLPTMNSPKPIISTDPLKSAVDVGFRIFDYSQRGHAISHLRGAVLEVLCEDLRSESMH